MFCYIARLSLEQSYSKSKQRRREGNNCAIVSRSGYIWVWSEARDQESTNHSTHFVEWKSSYITMFVVSPVFEVCVRFWCTLMQVSWKSLQFWNHIISRWGRRKGPFKILKVNIYFQLCNAFKRSRIAFFWISNISIISCRVMSRSGWKQSK